MAKRFLVTQVGEGGEIILAQVAEADEVFPLIVANALESNILPGLDSDARKAAVETAVRITGFANPRESGQSEVHGRTYRIEELPDDPLALNEFYRVRIFRPKFRKLLRRIIRRMPR